MLPEWTNVHGSLKTHLAVERHEDGTVTTACGLKRRREMWTNYGRTCHERCRNCTRIEHASWWQPRRLRKGG